MSFSLIAMRLSSVSVTEEWGLTVDMPKSIASFDMVYVWVNMIGPQTHLTRYVYLFMHTGKLEKPRKIFLNFHFSNYGCFHSLQLYSLAEIAHIIQATPVMGNQNLLSQPVKHPRARQEAIKPIYETFTQCRSINISTSV